MRSLVEGKDSVPVGVLANDLCFSVSTESFQEGLDVVKLDLLPSASVLGPPVPVATA